MIALISKLRIPTFLGLSILLLGIASGVYLVAREQNFYTKASPSLTPKNLTLTNNDDSQVTISWQTSTETGAFITYGQSPNNQTAKDDRDNEGLLPRTIHHVTLKNLLPGIPYEYRIIEGKYTSDILKFTTASPASSQNGFNPVIGSILNGNTPLSDGIVYLAIPNSITQSAIVKSGNFIIPLSTIRKSDLSDIAPLEEGTIAKITIISNYGESSALFKLKSSSKLLPPLRLGQNIDLTSVDLKVKEATQSGLDLNKYDLHKDGRINAADYATILQNMGKSPKDKKSGSTLTGSDLNGDGVIDQKDLDLMVQKLKNQ